jgi:hypothetical protein
LRPHGLPLSLNVTGPSGARIGSHDFGEGGAQPVQITPTASGWHTLELDAKGLAASTPYELQVTYTAPQALDV